jgi:DNA polymerase-3 subunit epsilon
MREIVIDTETTGLDCLNGDRLIEIGCVELLNHIPTGRTFHAYINPRRAISSGAVLVHGLTEEFLRNQLCFDEIADAFCEFISEGPLVAHNASFDCGFINMELELCGRARVAEHRFVDTLLLARRRHPNSSNSLDALCLRYGIDSSARIRHGALLDAEILAEVYLELLGGRQASLAFSDLSETTATLLGRQQIGPRPHPLPLRLTLSEERAHDNFVSELGAAALWLRYRGGTELKAAS